MRSPAYKPFPPSLAKQISAWIDNGHSAPGWLRSQRKSALDQLLLTGLPTRNIEEWKYTDIRPMIEQEWNFDEIESHTPPKTDITLPMLHADEINIVLINGIYQPGLSNTHTSDAIEVTSLRSPGFLQELETLLNRAETSRTEDPFALLNRAAWRDGIVLRISAKAVIPHRIHLIMLHKGITENMLTTPRIFIQADTQSEATLAITTTSHSEAACLNVSCMDIDVAEGARLTLCQTQALNNHSFSVASTRIRQQRDSVLHSLDAAFGSALSRHNLSVSLDGSGAETEINGIYTMREHQLSDFHTIIEHRQPHCRSRQVYKGILDGHATAVFNGAVHVHPGACGTDGYQLNRTLLRSPNAKVYTKPELQIANDDVRCSHGATIGQLDSQQIFYLQSRGISTENARNLLSRGFVEDLIFKYPSQRQRIALDVYLDRYFNGTP